MKDDWPEYLKEYEKILNSYTNEQLLSEVISDAQYWDEWDDMRHEYKWTLANDMLYRRLQDNGFLSKQGLICNIINIDIQNIQIH